MDEQRLAEARTRFVRECVTVMTTELLANGNEPLAAAIAKAVTEVATAAFEAGYTEGVQHATEDFHSRLYGPV